MKNIFKILFIVSVAFSLSRSLKAINSQFNTVYDGGAFDIQNERTECPICMEDVANLVQLPCRHLVCPNCRNQIRECPFCRRELGDFVRLINTKEALQDRLIRREAKLEEVRRQIQERRDEISRLEMEEEGLIQEISDLTPRYEPAHLTGNLIKRIRRFSGTGRFLQGDSSEMCNKLEIVYENQPFGNEETFTLKFNCFLIHSYEVITFETGKEFLICLLIDPTQESYNFVFFDPQTGNRSSMTEYSPSRNRYRYEKINTLLTTNDRVRFEILFNGDREKIYLFGDREENFVLLRDLERVLDL